MGLELLIQYGAIGTVLIWFMYRNEKNIKSLTDAINNHLTSSINNQSKTNLLMIDVISKCPSNGGKIRRGEINSLKKEIDKELKKEE
jgi:hypothetical protein